MIVAEGDGITSSEYGYLLMLKNHKHPNVVRVHSLSKEKAVLHREEMDADRGVRMLPAEEIRRLFVCFESSVRAGVQHLHKHKIIHADLKLENVLMSRKKKNGKWRFRLCDFNLSKNARIEHEGEVGTPLYFPPEILMKMSWDMTRDWWAFGIMCYWWYQQDYPFGEPSCKRELRNNIGRFFHEHFSLKSLWIHQTMLNPEPRFDESWSWASDFVRKCMRFKGWERPVS